MAYKEMLKVTKFNGKATAPPLVRIDVGLMPDPKNPKKMMYFLNELEKEGTNQLTRYVGTFPGNKFNLVDRMAEVYVKKAKEFLGMPTPELSWRTSTHEASKKRSLSSSKGPAMKKA